MADAIARLSTVVTTNYWSTSEVMFDEALLPGSDALLRGLRVSPEEGPHPPHAAALGLVPLGVRGSHCCGCTTSPATLPHSVLMHAGVLRMLHVPVERGCTSGPMSTAIPPDVTGTC